MTSEQTPAEPESVEVPMAWTGVEALDVLTANEFLITVDPENDMMYLTVGVVTPPPITGTPDEIRQQLHDLNYVPVRTLARFALSRLRAERLGEALRESLSRYDQAREREDA